MIFARDRWLPFRQILVADESGSVLVKSLGVACHRTASWPGNSVAEDLLL